MSFRKLIPFLLLSCLPVLAQSNQSVNGVPNQTLPSTRPNIGLLADYNMIDCTFSVSGSCPDSSGNSNNATVATSAINGTTTPWGAYFNPGSPYTGSTTPQYITLPTALNSANLFIISMMPYQGVLNSGTSSTSAQWNLQPVILGSADTSGSTSNAVMGIQNLGQSNEGGFVPNWLTGHASGYASTTQKAFGGPFILAISTGTGTSRFWVNGVELSGSGGSAISAPTTNWALGGYPGGPTVSNYPFLGTVGKVLAYSTSNTGATLDAFVKQATAYVYSVVSARAGYPVFANSMASQTTLLWTGDSIGAGATAGGTTIQQYLALNNTYSVVNSSVSSVTARTTNAMFQSRNQSYISSGGTTPSKCVIATGTNDVAIAGLTTTQTLAAVVQQGQQCHQMGGQSILVTQLSRNGQDTNIEALNTLERQYWRSSGAFDGIADVGGIPLLGASGAYSNTTYFVGGGVHPTSAGQQLYAGGVSNAINYLDGASASAPTIPSLTVGSIPTGTLSNNTGNQVWLLPTPLQAGNLQTISFQTAAATTSPITFALASGSGTSYTIVPGSSFTITPASTTSLQTFTAGTGFTAPVAAAAGNLLVVFATTTMPGTGTGGAATQGYYYFLGSSLPVGATTYTFYNLKNMAVTATVSGGTYAMTDADAYVQLGTGETGVQLPPCSGLTGQKFNIFSVPSVTVSNSSDAAGAIVGSTTIAANSTAVYQVNLYGGPTAVGCNYVISQ